MHDTNDYVQRMVLLQCQGATEQSLISRISFEKEKTTLNIGWCSEKK